MYVWCGVVWCGVCAQVMSTSMYVSVVWCGVCDFLRSRASLV